MKSPYFSTRVGRQSGLSDWQYDVAKADVPWVDIESDKILFTLPLNMVATLSDPTAMMQEWDKVMDTMATFQGAPLARSRGEYFTFDTQLDHSGYASGYPMVWPETDVFSLTTDYVKSPLMVLSPAQYIDQRFSIATMLHEWGHSHRLPVFDGEGESIVNTNTVIAYNTVFGYDLDAALALSREQKFNRDQAAIDWIRTENFRQNKPIAYDETWPTSTGKNGIENDQRRYQTRGHARWADLADIFGWDAIGAVNAVFYQRYADSLEVLPKETDIDDYIEVASNVLGVNTAPLFHFWGIQPSASLATILSGLPESPAIKARLEHYLAVAPANNAEWRAYSDVMFPTVGYYQSQYTDLNANFDVATGQEILDQIQFLLDTYFR